jgi:hypothetical protein
VIGERLDVTREQAGLARGRECASTNRTVGRAGGFGESAQARLTEVAMLAGCFVLLAQDLKC